MIILSIAGIWFIIASTGVLMVCRAAAAKHRPRHPEGAELTDSAQGAGPMPDKQIYFEFDEPRRKRKSRLFFVQH